MKMSLNKFMHPRNPFYNNPPDFENLAKLHPEFSTYCMTEETKANKRRSTNIDFKDPNALKVLYRVLMKHYFNLNVDLPINHLIPRVPQRLNYIMWIEDLLSMPTTANGIDIGCGTSCVFSLLICSLNKSWKMTATDIDDENIEWTQKNIRDNHLILGDRIKVLKVKNDTIFEDLIDINCENYQYDFMMCNPPFFKNEFENIGISNIRKPEKRHMPNSANTQKPIESIFTDGGEVGFVKKIITESIKTGKRIKLYTTMLGKKSSLIELRAYLTECVNVQNISETHFCQGHTMRWGLAWSFVDCVKLPQIDYFPKKNTQKSNQVKPVIFQVNKDLIKNTGEQTDQMFYYEYFKSIMLNSLKMINLEEDLTNFKIKLGALEKTWSNQRLKRRRYAANLSNLGTTSEIVLPASSNSTELPQKSSSNSYLIIFDLQLKLKNRNDLFLEFFLSDGYLKETLLQIFQYAKNKLENSKY